MRPCLAQESSARYFSLACELSFAGIKGVIASRSIPWCQRYLQMQPDRNPSSQHPDARRFCVLTVGRSGSTSLMNFLKSFPDIALPCRDTDCVDNELLNPEWAAKYAQVYAKLGNHPVRTRDELIECFYKYHADSAYVGFKSMPNRHRDFHAFSLRPDIQFITLVRDDIASTIASFLVAMNTGSWRRYGEPQLARWVFKPARDGQRVLSNLSYVLQSNAALRHIPSAIALTYEALCDPAFSDEALNRFFARQISIDNPRPPTHGSSYVENWDVFCNFLRKALARIEPSQQISKSLSKGIVSG